MSREGVATFLTRVMEDEAFRTQLQANPDATLAKFDLTSEEIAAIKSADPSRLEDLDVDERVSKTVVADAAALQGAQLQGAELMGSVWTVLQHIFWKSK